MYPNTDEPATTMLDLIQRLDARRFEFIRLRDAQILFDIPCEQSQVLVVGHPETATYEWVVLKPDTTQHSDKGYGIAPEALRDVLTAALGD